MTGVITHYVLITIQEDWGTKHSIERRLACRGADAGTLIMQLPGFFVSSFGAALLLCPATSAARSIPAFAVEALSDQQLSSISGTARSAFFARVGRSMTESEAMASFRISADVNRLAFDNWFTDVGNPLIFSNIAQQSSPR